MRDYVRFKHDNRTHTISHICSYGAALSRKNRPDADYQIDGLRISTEWIENYQKHGIERTGLAAWKRANHNDFRKWATKNGFNSVGSALKFINYSEIKRAQKGA